MAHPRLLTTSHRKALTVGMTAALLAIPMAGVGAAANIPGDDLLEEESSDATGLLSAVEGALADDADGNPVTDTADSLSEAVEPVTEPVAPVTEPVTEVIEKIIEPAPVAPPAPGDAAPGAPAPSAPADGGTPAASPGSGGVESAGSNPQAVQEPAATTRNADRAGVRAAGGDEAAAPVTADTAPPALRHEFNAGMRSGNGGLTLQPFQAPIVSNPFASQAPRVADDAVTSTPVPSVAQAFEASISEVPRQLTEPGVPAGMTATAAGLLLLVGAGHLLHRSGHLRRAVIR